MVNIPQVFINGLSTSATYLLIALGLTLAFGIVRIMNFAHGELYMLGAYAVWIVYTLGRAPFPVGVLVAMLVVAAFGVLIERFLFRPVRANQMSGFLVAVGLGFILQVVVGQVWGIGLAKPVAYAYPKVLRFLGASLGVQTLIIIVICFVLVILLLLFLRRTMLGQAMRACIQDAKASTLVGININTISALAMVIAAGFAGLAGGLVAPVTAVQPYMGTTVILKAFTIIIVGGVGSIEGTIAAAIFFGFFDSVFAIWDPVLGNILGLSLAGLILVVRPKGIFGRE